MKSSKVSGFPDQKVNKLYRWRQEPLSGYLVHGSNGEFAYLSNKERVDVIRVVKEEVDGIVLHLWCSVEPSSVF